MLAGAGTAPAAARVREPGVVAPSPAPMNLPAGPMAMGQPETSAASGPSSESALRVSSDSATPPARTWFPLEGLYPPDSPIASSFVKNGPAGAVAVLETVKPSVPVEGPDLRIGTGGAARAAAGRNGAGPVFQQAGITSYDITLKPGSNLISLPLMPDDTAIEAVLAGILDRVETVWQYDTSGPDPKWRSYAPGAPSDLRVMRDGPGYWVHLKEDGTGDEALTITGGDASGPARRVVQGWNLVGFTATTAGDAATDRAALVALYNATDGANWLNNGNWLSNAPMGVWDGVTTDSDGRVTHLDLRYNQLTGEIPAELGSLTNLERLNLRHNQLTGEIPAELGSLTNLERLNLRHNQLTGEIPAELGSLTNLERLDLNANQLTGEIPAELGSLTNLEGLSLYNNQLTGEIPAELGSLANLRVLSLYSNQLTGEIPAELGGLTNLIALYLLFNQLTGCIPEGLRNVANNDLAQLGLDYCMPAASASDAATDRAALAALYNATDGANWLNNGNWLSNAPMREWHGVTTDSDGRVTRLLLSNNQLTGEISAELGSLTNLEWLRLTSNQLTGEIPAELGSLTNLRALWLGGNQLTGEIPEELGSLTNLKYLDLSFNQLTGGIPAELGDLTHLEGLWLGGNQLTGEIPEELGSLTYLKNLYLHLNQLSGEIPSALADLSNLEALILTGNQLTGCIPNGLRGIETNDLSRLGLPFCDMPGAPTIATPIVPGDASLTVAWAAPINTGSSAITAYDLRYIETGAADKSDANWTVVEDVWAAGSGSLQYTLNGLTGGTQYAVQVRAVTADGDGPWSSSAIGTPATWGAIRSFSPPSAALGGEVVVTVTASGYGPFGGIMETLPAGFRYVSSSLPDDSVTVNGQEVTFSLLGETDFTYTVAAPSAEGSYSFSGVLTNSDRAEVPVGGAITIAVAAGAPLIVRYDANGNGMIEKNEVIAAINDYLFGEGDAAISKSDVIKLINLYLFAPSTPHNRPGAPEGLTAAGNGQTRIDLSWRAPASDGGAAITGYRIEVSENGSTWNDLVADTRNAATSYSHTGLTAGSTRHYRVSAINSAGTGPASNIATGTTATTAGDAATDRAALVALYNATDGANWRNNWLSNAPIGEWHGVTTDSDGRVTHLDLQYNRLTGGIPAELGSLTNLKWLYLNNNQLTGGIPAELGSLTNLERLDLSSNRLSGEIPAELGSLTNLVRLWLGGNQLTGEIPEELGNLSNLVYLYLHLNQLSGEIPAELGSLTNLERLDLSSNRLSGEIPPELGSLTNLILLDLSNNQLTGEIPSALADLSNLEALFLSGNQLTGCIPASLGDVAINYLAELGLSYCSGDQAPDLVASVTSVGDAGILYVGESFTINAEVHNQGTGPAASTTLRYYRSTDRMISTSDARIDTDHVDPVPVSETMPESLSRTAPSRTGTYYYGVCVDPVAGESNILNNCSQAFPATVLERTSPDLVASVTSVGDAGILYVGESFTINAEVHNQGTGPAASTTLRYYRSTDRMISTSDARIDTDHVDPVPVSETMPESLSRTAPSRTGTYYYGVCVDPVAGESNILNNCSQAFPATVLERTSPDLVASVTSVGDAGILYVGESFTINAVVYNQGTGPAASANLSYYRSTDRTISTSSDTLIGTDVVDPVPVSETRAESLSRTAPSRTGTYYYYVCVVPVAGESDTRNNCSVAEPGYVEESAKPDLVIWKFVTNEKSAEPGAQITFTVNVRNLGNAGSPSTTFMIFMSPSSTSREFRQYAVDVPPIGASDDQEFYILRPGPNLNGRLHFWACLDPVPGGESNTGNNCSDTDYIDFEETAKPDLITGIRSVGDDGIIYSGAEYKVRVGVRNYGNATSASTTLRFYRSDDRTISRDDDPLDSVTLEPLAPGASVDKEITRTALRTPNTANYYYGCVDEGAGDPSYRCSALLKGEIREPIYIFNEECNYSDDRFIDNFSFTAEIKAYVPVTDARVKGVFVIFSWLFPEVEKGRISVDEGFGSFRQNQTKEITINRRIFDLLHVFSTAECRFTLDWSY